MSLRPDLADPCSLTTPASRHSRADELRLSLAALRVPQWWYFASLPLAAAAATPDVSAVNLLGRLTLAVLAAAASLAFAFGLNAITDRAGDREVRKNPLAGRLEVPPTVLPTVWATALVALLLVLPLGLASIVLMAISLVAGAIYSAGPRLKARPVIGTLCNAAIFVPLLGLGLLPTVNWAVLTGLGLVFGVLLTQNQLIHEIADETEDRAAGSRTTAVVLGSSAARALALGLGVLAVPAILWLWPAGWAGLLGAAGLVAGTIATSRAHTGALARHARRAHRGLGATALAVLVTALRLGL
ncbi:MAG: 1,4-dihydroxy-2-naphthoate octaprenyltransferase [Myxococcota bacterium]|jgi:1,4-dihydroxy-2-naphthoate octaprenyltransferase